MYQKKISQKKSSKILILNNFFNKKNIRQKNFIKNKKFVQTRKYIEEKIKWK